MEKNKTNPFQLGLIAVAVVLGGGLLALGFMKRSEFSETKQAFADSSARLRTMESMEGYPKQETVDALNETLVMYKGKIKGVRTALDFATVSEFKDIPSGEFARILGEANEAVKNLYGTKNITLPENWHLGFEKYSTVPAPKNATGELVYQLEAFKWLHETLAKYNPEALVNLYRKPLEQELAMQSTNKNTAKPDVYVSCPTQLTFVGDEGDARQFLNELVKSPKYLFTIDTVKIKSVKIEVTEEEVDVPVEKEENEVSKAFSSFFEATDDSNEVDTTNEVALDVDDEEKLFDQILGAETVSVFVELDLNYLPSTLELPEL